MTEVLAWVTDTVPTSVRDAVLARAARLSPAARDVAELVCVVPGKTEPWLLEESAISQEAGIEGCLSIGMVRHEDGSLAFRHELTRRAFESSLPRARLQSLHAKVLAALEQRPGIPAARLAHHANGARNARPSLDSRPPAAAQAASVGAHRQAASHYQLALEYAQDFTPDELARLQEQLAYECYLTRQYERAIEAQRAALEFWRASGERLKEGDALRWLSRLSWFAGRRSEAGRYAMDAVVTLESLPPSPELAMAYCNRADIDWEAHETDSAIDWAQRTIDLAERWANDEILCYA